MDRVSVIKIKYYYYYKFMIFDEVIKRLLQSYASQFWAT